MKKALLVFTKVPKVGEVKTRLTEAKGGILTPEEANSLYESCMLDVIDVCLSIDEADLWICYNREGDRSYLDSILAGVSNPQKIAGVFPDQGDHFNERIQYAADYILRDGKEDRLADAVLIIGGDLPCLQPHIINDALSKMEKLSSSEAGQKAACRKIKVNGSWLGACLVEGACQEGGYSLVGFTCATPFNFEKMFYNLDGITALDMLVNKAEANQIPLAVLEMVPDIDIPVDLASMMPLLRALVTAAKTDPTLMVPRRTMECLERIGLQAVTLPSIRESV
ncbi:MAG: DUF2064 domain-containing protein [Peptococcaceae bacterium]|nr:DUF2064 domain-containing protein [Peptococcaceae bacterium]